MCIEKKQRLRVVTAASLFDGHDASINIMRRIMQSKGVEIIHLGHNRSAYEIVEAAIEEDVHAIAVTSYQGGHIEFFKYIKKLLEEAKCGHIKIFGGGGGTILPHEIDELHNYGIIHIYSPDDGRTMGPAGMIDDLIQRCSIPYEEEIIKPFKNSDNSFPLQKVRDIRKIARDITLCEYNLKKESAKKENSTSVVLGITGPGGAGKSSLTDEIVRRFLHLIPDKTLAVISVDPSKKKTGGALLGDRMRMNNISSPRTYMRSLATRENDIALSVYVQDAIDILKKENYDFIILESAGIGQSDASILNYCDISLYVMTPEYGAASQLEKINMLDYADIICINKFDKPGALDAMTDVQKQYKRNHNLWETKNKDVPVIGTIASQFNDAGTNQLFEKIINVIAEKIDTIFLSSVVSENFKKQEPRIAQPIIPSNRIRYLSEIAEIVRNYNKETNEQAVIASQLYQLDGSIKLLTMNDER